jgi:hypothetical protein
MCTSKLLEETNNMRTRQNGSMQHTVILVYTVTYIYIYICVASHFTLFNKEDLRKFSGTWQPPAFPPRFCSPNTHNERY